MAPTFNSKKEDNNNDRIMYMILEIISIVICYCCLICYIHYGRMLNDIHKNSKNEVVIPRDLINYDQVKLNERILYTNF